MLRPRIQVLLLLLAEACAKPAQPVPIVKPGYSNILPGDYVGPAACGECHQEKLANWSTHSHRLMNQDVSRASVRGDFAGRTIRYGGGEVRFDSDGDHYTMTLTRGSTRRRFRVTRTIGSRFMQFYAGVQIEGPEPPGHRFYTVEHKLPFGYWFKLARWMPTNYFDELPGAERKADGSLAKDPFDHVEFIPWGSNCMFCHNTYAYQYRALVGLTGFPAGDITIDRPALNAVAARAVSFAGDAKSLQHALGREQLVSVGISCESCHFGGREHAQNEVPIRFVPTSDHLTLAHGGGRKDAHVVNSICAQCHCGQTAYFPDGSAKNNSHEAPDLITGACKTKVMCTHCHDPHKPGQPEIGGDERPYVAACLGCHQSYRDAARRAEHTKHAPGTTCLDCHMPRIVQGLDEVVRSHRISSPTNVRMLAAAAPNACNLCHLDHSIEWTSHQLVRWGKPLPLDPAWAPAYGGSLTNPVGLVWLASSDAPTRVVASQAYARTPLPLGRAALPALLSQLDDPHANNRAFASFAIGRVRRRPLELSEYDPTAAPTERARQIRALSLR